MARRSVVVCGRDVPGAVLDAALDRLRGLDSFTHADVRAVLEDLGVPRDGGVSYRAADRVTRVLSEERLAVYAGRRTMAWRWRDRGCPRRRVGATKRR